MPGLSPLGPIAGKVAMPSSNDDERAAEDVGLFILGDAWAVRHYSGIWPGWRWMVRGQGPIVDQLQKIAPFPCPLFAYATTREEVAQLFATIRDHLMRQTPGLRVQSGLDVIPLNDTTCVAERFFQGDREVFRLFYDHMNDLQVAVRNTEAIWQFDAHPADPRHGVLTAYHTQNDVLYAAVAPAASGAADHVVLCYSDAHKPSPTIEQGLPRSEWMTSYEKTPITFASGILVAMWGRLSGSEVLFAEDPNDPAQTLRARIGQATGIPLTPPPALAPRLGGIPAAYAIRLEPGEWTATYYELGTEQYGGFSFVALSRKGAPPFMPVVVGNAGGIVHGGLTIEQYAMLSCERDGLLMQLGPGALTSPQMQAICAKYGAPFDGGIGQGRNGRIDGWEKMIQGDAAFSAQWAVHRGIAQMRLSGIEPSPEQIAAMAQQQQATTAALQQHAQAHADRKQQTNDGARQLIEAARQKSPQELVAACAQVAPDIKAKDVFWQAIAMIKNPDKWGKTQDVAAVAEKLARAHWLTMDEADRKFESGGKEEKYVKEVIADAYEKHGVPVPGFGGFLSRLIDKL